MTQVFDGRLVFPALASWLVAVAVIACGWRIGMICAAVGLGVVAVGMLFSRAREAILATIVLAFAVAVSVAWREAAVSTHWLRMTEPGSDVEVVVEVRDDPKLSGGTVTVAANVGSVAVRIMAAGRTWRDVMPGETVLVRGTVAKPTRRDLTAGTIRASGAPQLIREAPWYQRLAGHIRERFAVAASDALPADAAGLLPALVVGDMSHAPGDVVDDMKAAGLSHLTSVSGANFAILLTAVLALARAVAVGPKSTAVLCVVVLGFFVVLARPSPSVVRAAAMGSIGVLALVIGRSKQALPALGAAIIVLIAMDPALAVSAGFLLSVVATAGLILVAPGWSESLRERGVPRFIAETVAVASSAYVVTLPVIVGLTGTVSVVSVVANVLVAAVVAPVTILGAAGAVLAVGWEPLAVLVIRLTGPPLWWLLSVARWAAGVSWASFPVHDGVFAAVSAAIAVALALLAMRIPVVRKVAFVSVLGCLAGLSVAHATIEQ
ncbi:ComEC/Rec2 family competence protein [Smaragdicoccus niigatensis]|uniref:ComEC/Rec2 family competence protein n=1 Tax=Smaragdicoccus niigatensis TaxID=359359 RepID=UPI00036B024C|nr:ComEC/Rec2 family competence protein [Smaragdicoccus niigatensis]